MASIADMLVQSGLQSSMQTPDIKGAAASGAQMGAQLAQTMENAQKQRAELEHKKQELYVNKIGKIAGMYETASKLPPGKAREAMLKEAIPGAINAFALGNEFPPMTQKMFSSHPEVVEYLNSKVSDGTFTLPQLLEKAQDAQWVAQQIPEAIRTKAGEAFAPNVTENMEMLREADQKRIEFAEKSKNAATAAGVKQNQRDITNPMDLRKELTSHATTVRTRNMEDAYGKITNAFGGKPSPAGDISGVFAYMKLLDDQSTVREGEQAQARNAAGVPEQVRNLYNKLLTGESLSPAQRKDFIHQAEKQYRTQFGRQEKLNTEYGNIAKETGIKPQLVFSGARFKAPPAEKKAFSPTEGQRTIYKKASAEEKGLIKQRLKSSGITDAELKKLDE